MLISVFFGCETADDLGIQYDLGTDANVRFQEFTLPATNIFIDSLRTDVNNSLRIDTDRRVLVGTYSDALTGSTTAEGYFSMTYDDGPLPRVRATSDEPNPADTIAVDSIVFYFETITTIPKSGSVLQEFSVHELEDSLRSSAVYLSSLRQNPVTEIGSFSKSIDAVNDTLHSFKMSDTYAQTFFAQLSDIAGDSTKSIATTVFKSLGFIPGASSESISAINLSSDTTKMIIYSSPISNNDTTYLTEFRLNGKSYSYLERDRAGSSFDGITEFENFDLSDGRTVIDPLAGINAVFSISELEDFFINNSNILINNASLEFEYEPEVGRDSLSNFYEFFQEV